MKIKIVLFTFITITILTLVLFLTFKNISNRTSKKILFLGDSITSRYDLEKYYKGYNVINSGIAGNLTTDILNELDERVYKYKPDIIILLVGTNDIEFSTLTDDEIKNNIETIVLNIKEKLPKTKIYLESIYPVNKNINSSIVGSRDNKRIKDINSKLKTISKRSTCDYINMYEKLTLFNDEMPRIFSSDGLHLNKVGYFYITRILKKYINEGE